MSGFTFPTVGRLDHTSPPSRSSLLHDLRYDVPLRLPLHHPRSLRFPLASRYLASPLSFVLRIRDGDPRLPGLFLYRSPFRFLHFTRSWRSSRVPRLPLYAHAPLAITDPGGILVFAITHTGFMPSSSSRLSAFPATLPRVIHTFPMDHNYTYFGVQ